VPPALRDSRLGTATTQLCESFSVATQALLARELGAAATTAGASAHGRGGGALTRRQRVRHLLSRALSVGALAATSVSALTLFNGRGVINSLTTDAAVRAVALDALPLVLVCQVLKGIAYPVNGALMGGLDWSMAAATMWLAQAACVCAVGLWGGEGPLSLRRLWASLVLLFLTQVVVGLVRIASGTGPWKALYARL